MKCHHSAAFPLCGWLLFLVAHAQPPLPPSAPVRPVTREALKAIKYAPPAPPAAGPEVRTADPKTEPAGAEPLTLSPYIVRELPDRTFREVTEAFLQKRRLDSGALFRLGSSNRTIAETLLPPEMEKNRRGEPRLKLTLLRLLW